MLPFLRRELLGRPPQRAKLLCAPSWISVGRSELPNPILGVALHHRPVMRCQSPALPAVGSAHDHIPDENRHVNLF